METLRDKRKQMDITQKDLAEAIHVAPRRLSNFENGKGDLSFTQVVSLCKELGFRVTISDERGTFDCK